MPALFASAIRKENANKVTAAINFLNDRSCSSIKPHDFSSFLLTRLFAQMYPVKIYSREKKTLPVGCLRPFNKNNSLEITSKLLVNITSKLQGGRLKLFFSKLTFANGS